MATWSFFRESGDVFDAIMAPFVWTFPELSKTVQGNGMNSVNVSYEQSGTYTATLNVDGTEIACEPLQVQGIPITINSCKADKETAKAGETITWTVEAESEATITGYSWTSTLGTISGSGTSATLSAEASMHKQKVFCALPAAAALVRINLRRPFIVLVHLAGTAAAAHADIFQRSAKAYILMPLEMGQGNQDIGLHNRAADPRCLAVFAVGDGHLHIVRAPKPVADDNLATGGDGIKTVDFRTGQVLHRIASAAGVKGVAVRQERHSTQLADDISHGMHIIGAQICAVSQFTEMHLNRGKFSLKINVFDTCRPNQLLKLRALADADSGPEICKKNICLFHKPTSFPLLAHLEFLCQFTPAVSLPLPLFPRRTRCIHLYPGS